jgi:hypothetical protein
LQRNKLIIGNYLKVRGAPALGSQKARQYRVLL